MTRPRRDTVRILVLALVVVAVGLGIGALAHPGSPVSVAPTATPMPTPDPTATEPSVPPSPSPTSTPSRERREPEPRLPEATASTCVPTEQPVTLTVLTLNIKSGFGPGGFDLQRIARAIGSSKADVVLLQEVDRFRDRSRDLDMPRVLGQLTGMDSAFGLNVRGSRGLYGTATLSRYPIVLEQNSPLPNRPGLQQRGLLRTDIDVDGTRVSVFNTHLQNGSDLQSLRVAQLAAIRPLVRASRHPVIFGGDLNSGPGSPMLRLAGSFARDVWLDVGVGRGQTAPADSPRHRIDYLMYTEPFEALEAAVLEPVVSDHRGVGARFRLPTSGDEVCVPELDGVIDGLGRGTGDRTP